MLILVRISP